MRTRNTSKSGKKLSILDKIQYGIGLLIPLCFIIGFIPFTFDNIFSFLIFLILLQLLISVARLRFLNIILELILLFLIILSLIPALGYLFRFLGLLFGIFDMTTFRYFKVYQRANLNSLRFNSRKQNYNRKTNFKDAEFKEK